MIRKTLIFLLSIFILFNLFKVAAPVKAIDCEGTPPSDESGLRSYIDACNSKISSLKVQQQTLKAALNLLNSKINLTTAQIKSTTDQINATQKEIDTLSQVIVGLNGNLDQLTKVFISRVRELYKTRDTNAAILFFASDSYSTFQNRLKYLNNAQRRDQMIIREMESARLDFDKQKSAKEQKQQEMEALQKTLESQKKVLGAQSTQKNQLLSDTQNSEAQYQKLLSTAQSQLAAIRRFVTTQGGASLLSGQTVCDSWGCYYNQRDSQWGNQLIGLSSDSSMKEYGCLVTSVAMMVSHLGKTLTPGVIAANSEPFFGTTAYMNLGGWSVAGIGVNRVRIGTSTNDIDSELSAGRAAVVGISPYGSSSPEHFIVVKSKDGSDYVINDPFVENGHDIKFSSHYSLSALRTVDRVTLN